jgi:hypothetical protein
LRLNGGCGETYRDFWHNTGLLQRLGWGAGFDRFCRRRISPQSKAIAYHRISNSIGAMSGRNVVLSNHYLLHRNRFHFGNPAFGAWHGHVSFSPLQSGSLLAAARLSDQRDLMEGRVLFDLIEELTPSLNRLPFAGGFRWPAAFGAGDPGGSEHLSNLPAHWIRKGEAAQASRAFAVRQRLVKSGGRFSPRSIIDVMRQETRRAIQVLRDTYSPMRSILDDGFSQDLDDLWRRHPKSALAMCSKVLAIHDMCVDPTDFALALGQLPWREIYVNDLFGDVFRIDLPPHDVGRQTRAARIN